MEASVLETSSVLSAVLVEHTPACDRLGHRITALE